MTARWKLPDVPQRTVRLVLFFGVLLSGMLCVLPASTLAQSRLGLADDEPSSDEADESVALMFAVWDRVSERHERDLVAMQRFRPSYPFWQHIFTIPDGSVAFGNARSGELIAVFPARGDWRGEARWETPALGSILGDARLPTALSERREEVAELLAAEVGEVVHNATRGRFLLPNASRYGGFLTEWGAIYERFGVPADLGLAQAILESGLNGRIRSEAGALGFCQWLPRNWNLVKRYSPHVLEGYNQTTQAPYCAAYLAVLATKYGSFIPALSEHHAGGTNVGRTLINGGRLGADEARERYLLGSEFARDLRGLAPRRYRDVVRTYGPRSFLYSEMVFGNVFTVQRLRDEMQQERIHAMRASRNLPLTEITRETGLSMDEVRRFNPALLRQVPAGATLYLPMQVDEFGADVAFWHRAPDPAFLRVLHEFVGIEAAPEDWDDPAFIPVLEDFRERFGATGTAEGDVMAVILRYVLHETTTSGRSEILSEFRSDQKILRLFEQGLLEREASRSANAIAR